MDDLNDLTSSIIKEEILQEQSQNIYQQTSEKERNYVKL